MNCLRHLLRRELVAVTRFLLCVSAILLMTSDQRAQAATIVGITESFLEVSLSSSVAGIIMAEPFKEGDAVNAGQPVIELDRKLEELEVERHKLIAAVRRSDYEATAQLFEKTKGTSKEELQKKEAEYRVAVAEHEIALEQLRKRYIVAPFTGHITELLLHRGESCQPYEPVVRLVDTRQCYFVSNIEAALAATLKTNQILRLEIETGSAPERVEGRVTFLSPVADPASGLVKIKVLFPNENRRVRPGLAGKILLSAQASVPIKPFNNLAAERVALSIVKHPTPTGFGLRNPDPVFDHAH